MPDQRIQNVLVLGATGNTGSAIIKALQSHPQNYKISILTRPSSLEKTRAKYPGESIQVFTADYSSAETSPHAYKSAFENQDAIISAIATLTVSQQIALVDAAVASKTVQRFIPSEFGVDTSEYEILKEVNPYLAQKTEVVNYLKQHEETLSWSAICTGGFLDWALQYPGAFGWNIPQRTATVFDGGDTEYEATNLSQVGRAVANALSSTPSPGFADGAGRGRPMVALTRNKYVYVHSFTTTQNTVLAALEGEIGERFTVTHADLEEYAKAGQVKAKRTFPGFVPGENNPYPDGVAEMIFAVVYGYGGVNKYGKKKGLWNQALALPEEDFTNTIKGVVTESNTK